MIAAAVSSDLLAELRACPLFAELPEPERAALAARTERRQLAVREVLFHQGDPADAVYLLRRGQIRLSKLTPEGNQVIVALLPPGQLFAVVAAMQETRLPVTADAVVPSEVLRWPRRLLGEVMARYPAVAFEAMRTVSERMRELQDRFRELATLPVPQRLARTLLRMAASAGKPAGSGTRIALRLTRQDLAELTGTTLFTVSRTLSAWQAQGIIEGRRESIVVREPELLKALGEEPAEK
jgi:CRP/FNR family transcriptional regulator, nitrogen oxide reductase regulator